MGIEQLMRDMEAKINELRKEKAEQAQTIEELVGLLKATSKRIFDEKYETAILHIQRAIAERGE